MAKPNPFWRLRWRLQDEATEEKGTGGRAVGEKVIQRKSQVEGKGIRDRNYLFIVKLSRKRKQAQCGAGMKSLQQNWARLI